MQKTLFCLVMLGVTASVYAQSSARPATAQSFKVGGEPIIIPPPKTDMTEVFQTAINEKEQPKIYRHNGFWADIGVISDYEKLKNKLPEVVLKTINC